ncbi:MAG: hypothetical protein EB088_15765, partial [Betaproteobacteria bacterium]|nr:hypothetical protein [Betaproteobacteria bacterium]
MLELLEASDDSIEDTGGGDGPGAMVLKPNVVMDVEGTSVRAVELLLLNDRTTGVVDATAADTIEGNVGQMVALAGDSVGTAGGGVARKGNVTVDLVTELSVAADSVLAVNALYQGLVRVDDAATVVGSMQALLAVSGDTVGTGDSDGVDLRNDVVFEFDDSVGTGTGSSVQAHELLLLNDRTTGVVDARAADTLVGLLSDVQAVLLADSIGSGTNRIDIAADSIDVVVTDTGSLRAESLNAFDAYFVGGTVYVSASTVAGSMLELLEASDDSIEDTGGGDGPGAMVLKPNVVMVVLKPNVVMVVDGASTLAAADLITLSARTTGVVDASGATKIVGTSSEIAALLADSIGAGDVNGVALPASLTVVASGAFTNLEINSRINRLELDNVAGNQVTLGGAGQTVLGGSSGDTLVGSVGADYIDGGEGEDFLIGGSGADTLVGGAGGDVFIADELDSIVGGG